MNARVLLTIVLSALVLATFLSLGFWQLRRLDWKQGILADIEARIAAAPVAVPAAPDPGRDRYLPVAAQGVMTAEELHFLVSSRDFGPGYRVVSVFETQGRRILVDRGFVRLEDKSRPRAAGAMTVTGNLHWPDERDGYTPENDDAAGIWYAREVPVMADALASDPVLIVARSRTDPAVTPLPVGPEGIKNDHLEYAVTWFLFAATWVVMTGFALWRIRRRKHQG